MSPDGERKRWVQRFNPGIPIPPAASEIHGITDADVLLCPPFSELARDISRALTGKDLGGYNLWRLDLPMLDEELRRCGYKLDLSGVHIVDCFGIFQKKNPRKLEDAVRKYCAREHEGAHGALADADATADVFLGQLAEHTDLAEFDLEKIASYSQPGDRRPADVAGKLYRDAEGCLRYAFGKHKDKSVLETRSYATWMLGNNFPGSTLEVIAQELDAADAAQKGAA